MKITLKKNYQLAKSNVVLSLSKRNILDFVSAHPRITAILASIGISVTFSIVGRSVVDGILAPAYALTPTPCDACAKEFAPGQEAKLFEESQGASEFAPGQEKKTADTDLESQNAKQFAPGHQKEVIGDPGGDFGAFGWIVKMLSFLIHQER